MSIPDPAAHEPRAAEPGRGGPRPYRLSDHERTLAINALSDAFSEGRLDAEEFRERMSAASEARLASDLDPLFVDLPGRTPTFLHSPTAEPHPRAAQRRPQSRHAHSGARPMCAGRPYGPYGRMPTGYPHPVMFLPLIVLIVASTQLWFFLPLMFITLGMLNESGRARARRIPGGPDRRQHLRDRPDGT